MKKFAKTATSPNFLFKLLPHRYKEEDSYQPNTVVGYEEEGLLERFLEVFCLELDGEVAPYIDSLGLLVDAQAIDNLPNLDPDKFLIHLASDLGNPPDIGTLSEYKTLLQNTRLINQHKGTRAGLELFLAVFKYKISSMTESSVSSKSYDNTPTPLQYDNGVEYDYGFTFYSGYDLAITDLDGTGPKNPSEAFLLLLQESIQKYISPVFATLNTLTYI